MVFLLVGWGKDYYCAPSPKIDHYFTGLQRRIKIKIGNCQGPYNAIVGALTVSYLQIGKPKHSTLVRNGSLLVGGDRNIWKKMAALWRSCASLFANFWRVEKLLFPPEKIKGLNGLDPLPF
jgi:hypothetical protein